MSAWPDWFDAFAALLPGDPAWFGRYEPPAGTPVRSSAVLILLGEDAAGPDVLLTSASSTLRAHTGQVAFPAARSTS